MYETAADTKITSSGIYLLIAIIICNILMVTAVKSLFYKGSYTVKEERQSEAIEHNGQHWNLPGFNLMP